MSFQELYEFFLALAPVSKGDLRPRRRIISGIKKTTHGCLSYKCDQCGFHVNPNQKSLEKAVRKEPDKMIITISGAKQPDGTETAGCFNNDKSICFFT